MSAPGRRNGICDLCDARTEVRSTGNGFMVVCDPCDKAIPEPEPLAEFDFTGLAHRLMQEQKALVAATSPDDLGVDANLMRAISRALHAAVMLAFLANDVRQEAKT